MSPLAIAFTGPSNSGKTTLIVKLSEYLRASYKIALIKHDPKDKAVFDVEGKDSFKFFESGADVIVASSTKTTLFSHRAQSLKEMISLLKPFDILLVEGLKTLDLPRIGIFRDKIDESYLPFCKAIAIDSVNLKSYDLPENLDILDINDTQKIADWILKNAKAVG